MTGETASIVRAKVELLENMMIWVLMRELRREADPEKAAAQVAEHYRNVIEANAARNPVAPGADPGALIALEVMETFFDRLRSAVKGNRRSE